MSILNSISKPKNRPIICTITGDAGTGKTTLAATFPKPVFIRAEDGLQSVPEEMRPDAFPLLSDSEELWGQMAALIKEEHDYKTVVFDSVTKLDLMFTQKVLDMDQHKPKSINQALGGYGAGHNAVAAMHQRVRKGAQLLNDRGINVVFIAHSETSTVTPPDDEPFTRYELRLNKKSETYYVDDVDVVAYIKLEKFVRESRATSTGGRILVAYSTAANVSKNRCGITEDLPFKQGENPLKKFVRGL